MPQNDNTEEDLQALVRRAQTRDDDAFDQIVHRFQDRAVGYAYVLLGGDIHRAEDAAQDAFLQAFQDLPVLREPLAFPHWLNRIVFKYCSRTTRRKRPAMASLESAAEIACPRSDSDPVKALEEADMKLQVRAAIRALPEAERAVVTLFYLGDHSQAEVAEFLQVPITTVKKRMQRARARLKERMLEMVEETLRGSAPSRDARFGEVASLLRRITDLLKGDERVAAAYLAHFGSDEGFGAEDDAWSSLNVHVVLADDAIDAMATERRHYVAPLASPLASPLLFVEGPQNAPPGGYYLMAVYDGEDGPYEVDWYWHRRAGATIPADSRLLFDRASLPKSAEPTSWGYTEEIPDALAIVQAAMTPDEKSADELRNIVSLFWAMLLISSKYVARNPYEEQMGFLPMLQDLLGKAARRVGPMPTGEREPVGPLREPAAKLAVLRELAGEMEGVMGRASARHTELPFAAVPRVYRFIEMVESG